MHLRDNPSIGKIEEKLINSMKMKYRTVRKLRQFMWDEMSTEHVFTISKLCTISIL